MQVTFTLALPRVVGLAGFLSSPECAAIIAAARPQMQRSTGLSRADGSHEVIPTRTSTGCFIANSSLPFLDELDERIRNQFGLDPAHSEWLQVLRYGVGEEYQPHFDYFDPADSGSTATLARGGNRIASLLMYLNTVPGGGETTFPDAGLKVAAVQGNAVHFAYPTPDKATLTLHGGAPVTVGEKWVATKWYREGVFV